MRSREAVRLQDLLPAFHAAGHHEGASEADRSSFGALLQRKVFQVEAAAIRRGFPGLLREAKYRTGEENIESRSVYSLVVSPTFLGAKTY